MRNHSIIDQNFTNQDFSNKKLPGKEYDNCRFINCNFTEADMSVVTFLSCSFADCNFTKVMMKQTVFRDECVFEGCKLMGVSFGSCDDFMFSVEFRSSILDYASFYGIDMKNTRFTDCRFIGADFTEANIKGSEFKNCDLKNTIFEQTNAEKVDFTSAINFSIDPTQNRLKKARFSSENLAGLLKKYDLIIE